MNLPTSLLETVIGLEDVYMPAFPFGPNSSEGLGECKIHSGGRVLIEYNIAVLVLSENPDNRRHACDLQIVLAKGSLKSRTLSCRIMGISGESPS